MSQIIKRRVVSIVGFSLLLFFTPVAIADFKPTDRKPASDYSRSAGKRGRCANESSQTIPLTLLAPQTYVGYTTSLHPTFVGFISSSERVELRIFEFSSDGDINQISDAITQDVEPGVFQISSPKKYPDLIVGKKYLWQLAINCSGGVKFEAAEFIVTEISPTLQRKLSRTKGNLQKANIYAEESLWYEALIEALKSEKQGKLGKLGSNLVKNLAEYETPGLSDKEDRVKIRIQHLQTIAMEEQS
jgi:hypothetical protein